ncbi:MAG: hypothetical protein H6657_20640 [Ardenticatenaceae bacterium]|nr:hypothetical protein [Ardenticatenaceae bacterium]
MTSDLLARSLKLLRQNQFFIWLGLGMSLSSLFGTGWRLWLAQVVDFDFAQLAGLQSIEALLFSSEVAQMQQLLIRGLLLAFGQFVLVWLVALWAEAGVITAVTHHASQPITLRQSLRWGRQWLGRFLAIDLLVFFPWFLIALLMFLVMIILALVLVSFARSEPSAGAVLLTTGLGVTCMIGLAGLLLPVGLGSLWYRLLAFREAVLHGVEGRTAARQTWQRIRQNFGDVFVLIVVLWGGPTMLLGILNFITSPLLTWLTSLTTSDTIALQTMSWLAVTAVSLLAWLLRGIVTAFVAIAWTLAYQNLKE